MIKLKSLEERTVGKSYTMPIVGKVSFDSDNCIYIEKDDEAQALLSINMGIRLVIDKSFKEKKEDKKESVLIKEEDEQIKLKKEALKDYSLDELKELLDSFPETEKRRLKNKASIVNYLAKHM